MCIYQNKLVNPLDIGFISVSSGASANVLSLFQDPLQSPLVSLVSSSVSFCSVLHDLDTWGLQVCLRAGLGLWHPLHCIVSLWCGEGEVAVFPFPLCLSPTHTQGKGNVALFSLGERI